MAAKRKKRRRKIVAMRPETEALLLAADHPTAWEFPPDFDYWGALTRVRAVAADIKASLDKEARVHDQVQDASFFAEISVNLIGSEQWQSWPAVSFSAFGSLFTVYERTEDVAEELFEPLITLVVGHGFVYVPSAELDAPYTGKHPLSFDETWCHRFFAYG